ncbi:hypothetical protein [Paraburkholderia saeva]|uniref:hypothetical protein n=1 Tax=Paraburkholderia saeva TaxID=2777537 RepID=UPI001E589865|nr:hypothetical protein [Paraburkholderia saeva]
MTIAENWDLFDKRVIDPSAPQIQRNEMRMAFYAGIHTMLCLQFELAALDNLQALAVLNSLHREGERFMALFTVPTAQPN